MAEIQTVDKIEEKKEAEEQYLETEENHEALKEIRSQILRHNEDCKECGRKDKCYKSLCQFCYIQKMREITEELQERIREEGRSNLISTDKMKIIRDKLLDLV